MGFDKTEVPMTVHLNLDLVKKISLQTTLLNQGLSTDLLPLNPRGQLSFQTLQFHYLVISMFTTLAQLKIEY